MDSSQGLGSAFATMAREAKVTHDSPRITYEGQATFWKECARCGQMMPHVRRELGSECVVCGPVLAEGGSDA